MTDAERQLWVQAQDDYTHALLVAFKALHHDELDSMEVSDTVVQAGAATVLIHITKLRQDIPRSAPGHHPAAAPTAVKGGSVASPQASVAAPPCPGCGGPMWDNRGRKKNPKAPDFKCKDKSCLDAKGYNTGCWEKDLKPSPVMAAALAQQKPPRPFADLPEALEEGEDDGLPF